ncbi:MAG: hypothetical protein ACLQNE_01635 [Thermoguttaceae bacterium]
MFVIRKGSLIEEQYLDRNGKWGPYPKGKRFSTQDAAERFMLAHDAASSGIFPCWRARQLWEYRNRFVQCPKTGKPINRKTVFNSILASDLEWAAEMAHDYGRFIGFDPYLCTVWTYAPCETTYEAIFGSP